MTDDVRHLIIVLAIWIFFFVGYLMNVFETSLMQLVTGQLYLSFVCVCFLILLREKSKTRELSKLVHLMVVSKPVLEIRSTHSHLDVFPLHM